MAQRREDKSSTFIWYRNANGTLYAISREAVMVAEQGPTYEVSGKALANVTLSLWGGQVVHMSAVTPFPEEGNVFQKLDVEVGV